VRTKIVKTNCNKIRREPWITGDILADMRKRDRLSKIKSHRDEYKALRNDLVARIRRAERDNLSSKIKESWNDINKGIT
jgi:hypothetical protein